MTTELANADKVFLYTLLDFTIAGTRYLFINDTEALTSGGDTYHPAAFKAELLPQPERGLKATRIVFSNINPQGAVSELGEIVFAHIQSIMGTLVTLRRVFRYNPDNILIDAPLEVLGLKITPKAVTFSVGFYNLHEQTLPRLFYDDRTAPGLA